MFYIPLRKNCQWACQAHVWYAMSQGIFIINSGIPDSIHGIVETVRIICLSPDDPSSYLLLQVLRASSIAKVAPFLDPAMDTIVSIKGGHTCAHFWVHYRGERKEGRDKYLSRLYLQPQTQS